MADELTLEQAKRLVRLVRNDCARAEGFHPREGQSYYGASDWSLTEADALIAASRTEEATTAELQRRREGGTAYPATTSRASQEKPRG